MTDLYIANCTKQPHDFLYRVPENHKIVSRLIEPGTQIRISDTEMRLDAIIAQHLRYGLIPVKELKNGAGFSGMLYSKDKPIDVSAIRAGIESRDTAIETQSFEMRQAAAVAVDENLSKIGQQGGPKLNSFEMEVVEQPKGPADRDPKFRQTIAVKKEGQPDPKPRSRSRKAA